MKLNITDKQISLEDFKSMFDKSNNIKDVYLLCHQAGCPVYIIRNKEDKCNITWHPSLDNSEDIVSLEIREGIFCMVYRDKEEKFYPVDSLKDDILMKHIIGNNPFDEKFLVWGCKDSNN